MANYSPNRTGLSCYYTKRRVKADIAVNRAIARLSKRNSIPPAKALSALVEALKSSGISKRTLQRYWQSQIATLRQALRKRYRPPKRRRHDRMLAALTQIPQPLSHIEKRNARRF
ncbi:MAG: hypothetical protein ACE5JU_24565 [Candidatus Binatia bacterium]